MQVSGYGSGYDSGSWINLESRQESRQESSDSKVAEAVTECFSYDEIIFHYVVDGLKTMCKKGEQPRGHSAVFTTSSWPQPQAQSLTANVEDLLLTTCRVYTYIYPVRPCDD